MTTFLEPAEIASLTGYQRSSAQVKALRFMGIDHKLRPDGSVAILRAVLEACFTVQVTTPGKAIQPNWGALATSTNNEPKRPIRVVTTPTRSGR